MSPFLDRVVKRNILGTVLGFDELFVIGDKSYIETSAQRNIISPYLCHF